MEISQQATRKKLSQASAISIAKWLQRCGISCGNKATDQIGRCEFGHDIFDELTVAGIADGQAGHLSFGLPEPAFSGGDAQQNLYWSPIKLPPGKSICVASSRLSKKLDTYDSWFDAIRTMAARLDPADYFFVTGSGTTTDAFLQRIGQLFGFAVLEFKPFPERVSAEWFQGCLVEAKPSAAQNYRHSVCYFGASEESDAKHFAKPKNESIDQLLIQIASEVRLLSVRKNGNIFKATRQRLAQDPPGETKLLIDVRLTSNSLKDELMAHGATAWWLYHEESQSQSSDVDTYLPGSHKRASRPEYDAPILDVLEIKPDQFLLHWTRRRVGPWPDQTDQEYLDDLIFRSGRRYHEEISSLARILACRRILGTNQLTRSKQPVACFSNIPLDEIKNRKVFRKHLARWDCQPFGIAIDRERLSELGARPVVYGDDSTWQKMDEHEKVFFQLAGTQDLEIDWQEEGEWRLVGDLDLNLIDANSAVVFVGNSTEANLVSPISRWPIVILNANT